MRRRWAAAALLAAWILMTPRGPIWLRPGELLTFSTQEECEEAAAWLHAQARAQGWAGPAPWYVCEERS